MNLLERGNKIRSRWLPLAGCVSCALAVLAPRTHVLAATARSNERQRRSADAPPDHRNSSDSTAEDILRALRRVRPQGALIRSARMKERGEVKVKKKLYPEGSRLLSQIGGIHQEGRWWYFDFEESGESFHLKMLPNATLETVVRSARGQVQSIQFVISGERTVFHGENYLLPRIAMRAVQSVSPNPRTPESTAPSESSSPGQAASADEVLARLRTQQPRQQVLPRAAAPRLPQAGRPRSAVYWQDGAPLVRRPGRLVPRGDWLTFVFESATPDFPEPPLKLLPNQTVELMEQTNEQHAEGVVFIVSGEITAFLGENYLLPRVALRRVDIGNLTK